MITYHVEGDTGAGWVRLASVPTEPDARKLQKTLRDEGTFKGVRVSKLTITLEVVPDVLLKARRRRTAKPAAQGPFDGQ